MKKVTCSAMGGPCEHEIVAGSAEESAKAGYEHIANTDDEAHKAIKEQIDSTSDEDKAKWMEGFKETFEKAENA